MKGLPVGVYPNGRGFAARITRQGTIKYLGTFDTAEEAGEVYQRKKVSFSPTRPGQVPLWDIQGEITAWTTVSPEDYAFLLSYRWHCHRGYASHSDAFGDLRMHKLIATRMGLSISSEESIDHKNRPKLDNRRENLRIVNQTTQCRNQCKQKNNTSGFIGVCFHKSSQVRSGMRTLDLIGRENILAVSTLLKRPPAPEICLSVL